MKIPVFFILLYSNYLQMKKIKLLVIAFIAITAFSCNKESIDNTASSDVQKDNHSSARVAVITTENFETGTKTAYTAADVTLTTGVWNLNDALIGNTSSDAKNGTQSARVRNSGKLTMKFDLATGAGIVTVNHAKYGSDAAGTWEMWYSTNSGASYVQTGAAVSSSSTTLQSASFTINITGNVRIEIRKTDGGTNRINFDDIVINDYAGISNAVPVLTSISPASATAGSAAFTITATGTDFVSGATINWNGTALATTFSNSTQLTATVSAASVATAGTASVTAFNPSPGGGTSTALTFTINAIVSSAKKFLFDNTKAETAGNADWVIDEDSNNPLRFPTPLQSTVTSSTSETYWTGALSSWGIALVKAGNTVETLPSSGIITYGSTTNAQDLSKYDVFVVDEPNTRFTASEKVAIINFVKNGGGLFMISDHTISDRNGDGWDSPDIWNDLMTNNTVQNNPFGFSIDLTNISGVSSNVLSGATSNVILNGSQGSVTQLEFNNGATVSLNPSANPTVQGLIWKSSSTQNNSNALCASSTYMNGRVFVVTDSSPMDDGTGASGNILYVSWTKYSHKKLFMNASLWLAKLQ